MRVAYGDMIKLLNAEELKLIICGSPIYDFFELEKSTRYMDGFNKDSKTVKYILFFEKYNVLDYSGRCCMNSQQKIKRDSCLSAPEAIEYQSMD